MMKICLSVGRLAVCAVVLLTACSKELPSGDLLARLDEDRMLADVSVRARSQGKVKGVRVLDELRAADNAPRGVAPLREQLAGVS